MSNADLNAKQCRFIDEYLMDGNGARSAVAAGYGRTGAAVAAHRLLRNANVRQTLRTRQAIDAARLGVKRENLVAGLLDAVKMGRQRGEPSVMISALREIGRLMGFYDMEGQREPFSQVEKAEPFRRMSALSDLELATLISNDGRSARPK